MPATPIYGLRYPAAGDAVNVPLDLQELAEDVEDALDQSIAIPVVTSLPGSPTDGEEIYYLVDATNRVMWHLRYNAAGGTYKWEFLGGPPMFAEVATDESTTSATYVSLATPCQVVLARAGFYEVDFSAYFTGNIVHHLAPKFSTQATQDVDRARGPINETASRKIMRGVTPAGTVVLQLRGDDGTNVKVAGSRTLAIRPVRLG